MRKNKKKNNSRLNNILEFPEEISNNEPNITIIGFKKIMVENYKGILEYENFFVRLNTTIGVLNINGFNLKLSEMTSDDIMISGDIDSIDFEKTEE